MKNALPTFAMACLLAATTVDAGEIVYFAEGQLPDPARIASLLAAPRGEPAATVSGTATAANESDDDAVQGRTRAIRLLDAPVAQAARDSARDSAPTPVRPIRQASAAARTRHAELAALHPPSVLPNGRIASFGTVALQLRFLFDSSELHPANYPQLDAVAAGLKRLPENAVINVAGHTDAHGHPLYNIDLSLKRAMAVREYLVRTHGIPKNMIVAVGKGKSEPYNRANPYAPENRRVQIHAEYESTAQPGHGGVRLQPAS